MEDWQKRVIVIAERDDLKEKFEKLDAFLKGDKINDIAPDVFVMMNCQHSAMEIYLECLNARIKAFDQKD